ncbi:winged helix-turn-helix domain-containing protein [Vibrio hangzhouensis]|uniref:Cholera toxin transcriptional activator n=1 Tax=Vibrio hangzhouensis TaxID=462991 RepID=A0A1H6B8F3_9VIBR|nr:winged helix-turn-helix domain-containing protein [Vibrio hangzhouensis]SEG56890.1 cholera toxin transcriptional activator [Vibrio hangzhouensis]
MNNMEGMFTLGQEYIFNPNDHTITEKNNNLDTQQLGSNENRILQLFISRPNEIISRNEFHEYVWREQGIEVEDSSLTQAISTLRKQLCDSTKCPKFIQTVPRRGYKWIGGFSEVQPPHKDVNLSTTIASTTTEADTTKPILSVISAIKRSYILMSFVMLTAMLLPLIVYAYNDLPTRSLRTVGHVSNVEILIPEHSQNLAQWQATIEQCINRYIKTTLSDQRPTQVIVTTNLDKVITLNFVHALERSGQNTTMHLANQTTNSTNERCALQS